MKLESQLILYKYQSVEKRVIYDYDHAAIGRDMRERRQRRKLSQREVSRRMGKSAPYVGDLEAGKRNWRGDLIDLYLNALEAE